MAICATKREGRVLKASVVGPDVVCIDVIDMERGEDPDTSDHAITRVALTLDRAEAFARDILEQTRAVRMVTIVPTPSFDVATR